MEDNTKRFYNATAREVADRWYPNSALMPTIREFLSFLPPNPRVLDLGCGPGHESMRLRLAGARVLGLDFSEECIKVARSRCPQCHFEIADFRELDMRFGQFDGVFAAGSLIHIPHDGLGAVMDRMARVLRSYGCILVIVRDGEGVRESWPVVDGKKTHRVTYLYRHDDLASASKDLIPCGELELDDSLSNQGWRAHLFRVTATSTAM